MPGVFDANSRLSWFESVSVRFGLIATAALTATSLTIPVDKGRMVLGTWQGIYLFEHRSRPHRREVVVQAMGTEAGNPVRNS